MKQKLKYGFRKSKVARSLCGAVLGAAAIVSVGAVSASADEVKAEPEKTVVKTGEESVAAQPQQEKEQPSSAEEFKDLDKTPVEVEKVEKAAPVVENPNPTPAEPKQPEFKPEVKATENSVETVADKVGSSELNFTAKAPTNTSKTNEIEPLTTTHIYDTSVSYAGKLKASLLQSRKIIEANTNPQSKHILQTYAVNFTDSYVAVGVNDENTLKNNYGVSSLLLTKEQALGLIDKLMAIKHPSEKGSTFQKEGDYYIAIAKAFGELGYKTDTPGTKVPFEDIVTKLTKPTDTISVIQYTDGWGEGREEMDPTFANWAKTRAKTFMTVVNRNKVTDKDTNSNESINQMKKLGHPNIYDATGKDPKIVDAEVLKQFMETATEKVKVTKGENQTAKITIGGAGIEVTKTTLKGKNVSKDLPIKDGKVDFTEKLPDGDYEISYNFTGVGTVTASVSLDGKEAAKKADTLSSKGGFVKADFRTNDGKTISGKSDLTVSEAGKEIGADWKAPEADKSIMVNGQTYMLVGAPKTQTGKVTKDNVTLHYVYQAKPSDKKVYTVTFKVLDAITGKQIDKEFVVAKGFEGSGYNVLSPKVDGYEVSLKEGSAAGKLSNKDVTLTYLAHEKGGQVKAIFTDESGKELKDSQVVAETGQLVGSSWKYDSELQKELKVGDKTYILTAVPERLQGEVTSDNQTLKFVYKLKEEPKPEQPAKPAKPKADKVAPKTLPKTSAVPGSNVSKTDSSAQLALVAAASVVSYAAGYGYTKKRKNN
ncbi:MucBP domain-containing protein [Streptococcus cristatus]|uniref:MucBP domain-containing protein n=1 Tax=Streptococcus cristatus TaxID=45634 RepID=UPI0036F24BBD